MLGPLSACIEQKRCHRFSSTADCMSRPKKRCEAGVSVVGTKSHPVLATRAEHSVWLFNTLHDEIIDHCSNISAGSSHIPEVEGQQLSVRH